VSTANSCPVSGGSGGSSCGTAPFQQAVQTSGRTTPVGGSSRAASQAGKGRREEARLSFAPGSAAVLFGPSAHSRSRAWDPHRHKVGRVWSRGASRGRSGRRVVPSAPVPENLFHHARVINAADGAHRAFADQRAQRVNVPDAQNQVPGDRMGMRGGAVFHMSSISAGVRP
jgi:hypothetical protein